MTRYTIRFQHPDGTTQTVPNAHTEAIRSYGEKTIAEMEANREDVYDEIDYVKEESEVELVDNDTDTVVWAGLLRDVVYEGSTAIISVDSYEQYAVNEEPIRNLVFSQLDDATIFRLLLSELDELSAGTVESVSDDISQSFSDVDHAKALDQIAGFGGGHPIYNEDKTVDYVESRGRDRPNTVLAPRFQNVKFVKPDRQNRRAITHLRMLGDGVKVDVVASDYKQGDPQRWMVNDDHTDVSDRGKLASLGEQELTRVTNNLDRVRVEVRDIDMALGDTLTVDYAEKDIVEEQLHVTELTTVYDRGISYKATLESQIVLGRPLEYDSAPSAWVSYRCSQRSRGYTDDAVNPEDRWTSNVVSTAFGTVGKSVPEVAISGDTVAVASTFKSSDGSEDALLNVYDAQTGEERYEKNIDSGETAGCLIAGPYVVVASKNSGEINAYDKYTGELYASAFETGYSFDGQPQHDDGVVYLPLDDGTVRGFDLFDGFTEVYQTGSVGGIARSPAIGEDRLYTVDQNGGTIAAYRLDDGSEVWSASIPLEVTKSPAYFDGVVVVQNSISGSDDEIYAFDASDGTELWSTANNYDGLSAYEQINGPVPTLHRAPPLVEDSATTDSDDNTLVAYVVNDAGELRILDVLDGGSKLTTISLSTDVIPQVAAGAGSAYLADESVPGLQVVNLSSGSVSTLESPYSDMVVSPSVGSNVVASVAHNSADEQEEVVVWYQEPESAPSQTTAPGDEGPPLDETPPANEKPKGDTSNGEYIDAVRFGAIDNQSGDNGGYASFIGQEHAMLPGGTSTLEVDVHSEVDVAGDDWHVYVAVDWDRDGSFQDESLDFVGQGTATDATVSTDVTVPDDVAIADMRLRVVMTRISIDSPPVEGDDYFGETEDYTLAVVEDKKYSPIRDQRVNVSITSVDSPVGYREDATVKAEISNNASFSETVLPTLDIDGVTVDVGGRVTISSGGTKTVSLTWDVSDGFPAPPAGENRDWEACILAEADGISDKEFGDCTTVTVKDELERTKGIYVIEASDKDFKTSFAITDAQGTQSGEVSSAGPNYEPRVIPVTPTEVTVENTGSTGLDIDIDGTGGGGGGEGDPGDVPPGTSVTVDMSDAPDR
jgi:outer membrane protein assembly factor BamB